MDIHDPLELVSLTACLNGRFEKEFEGVQDVFELQVRTDTSTRRMTTAFKTFSHVDQLRPPLSQLPCLYTIELLANRLPFLAQPEQLLRLRSRPLRRGPHRGPEGCSPC